MITAEKPLKAQRSRRPSRLIALLAAAAMVAPGMPAQAQGGPQRGGGGPPTIRDAEVEQLLREYT